MPPVDPEIRQLLDERATLIEELNAHAELVQKLVLRNQALEAAARKAVDLLRTYSLGLYVLLRVRERDAAPIFSRSQIFSSSVLE